jgi:pimeloyl-ACP methyl ester carboxylesterase
MTVSSTATGSTRSPSAGTWALRDRVRVRDGEVATDVVGAGPPVVLVHGTPSWSYLWRDVVPVLARTNTVHLWDLLGYGDSRLDPGAAPSVAGHARTLTELVEHWDLDAPSLVGHDIGGATVLRAHLVHGVPARSLALLDTAVLSPWVTPVAQHMQEHQEAYRTMPGHIFDRIIAAHLHTTTHRPLSETAAAAYLDHYAGPDGQQRYLDQVAHFTEDDTRDVVARLGEVTAPTRVIWGEHDGWIEPAAGRRLAELLPGSELVTIPDSGHFLTEDNPAATAEALRDLLVRG